MSDECMMNKVWMNSKLRMSDEYMMNKVWINSKIKNVRWMHEE